MHFLKLGMKGLILVHELLTQVDMSVSSQRWLSAVQCRDPVNVAAIPSTIFSVCTSETRTSNTFERGTLDAKISR